MSVDAPIRSTSGTGTIRAFVAVALPPVVVEAVRSVQIEAQSMFQNGSVRWTPPDHLHLTLKFLGEVRTSRLNELTAAMERACEHQPSFRLGLEGIGCFPDANRPRVVWVGVLGDVDSLARVQSSVALATSGFGNHAEDSAFHPHVTIGRIVERTAGCVADRLKRFLVPKPCEWLVSTVTVMESRRTPEGSSYCKLAAVTLAKNAHH